MRVLQGLIDIGGQANRYSRALNEIGIYSESWFYERTIKSEPYDKVINLSKDGLLNGRIRKLNYAAQALMKFDVWHIHKGYSFLHNRMDLRLARNLGKKVIVHYRGSEIRADMQAKSLTNAVIDKISKESSFADIVLVKDGQLAELMTPFCNNIKVFPNIVDVSKCSVIEKKFNKSSKLKVVHIPSNPRVKGTNKIRKVLQSMNDLVDYVELTNLSHVDVLNEYKTSDIVIDQILTGTYGNASLEAMALGTTVLNYLDLRFTSYEPEIPPIYNINEDTLREVILDINNNREMLIDASYKGIAFIQKYHSNKAVGKELVKLYNSL